MDSIWYWAGAALAAGLLAFALPRLLKKPPPPDTGEDAPVPVEGTTACTGRHKGVKYWVYFENAQARVEIEAQEEIRAPFSAARQGDRLTQPGDGRDLAVRELSRLGALCVEAGTTGRLISAAFEERALNANAGSRFAPRADEAAANKVVDFLLEIRDKGR